METQEKTVFERIGGMTAVNAAVEIFYKKVLADEKISFFFTHTDMMQQAGKQRAFLAYAFGATLHYKGEGLRHSHAHLVKNGLNNTHFDAVIRHLMDTLVELNVPMDLIVEVISIAENTKNDVLGM